MAGYIVELGRGTDGRPVSRGVWPIRAIRVVKLRARGRNVGEPANVVASGSDSLVECRFRDLAERRGQIVVAKRAEPVRKPLFETCIDIRHRKNLQVVDYPSVPFFRAASNDTRIAKAVNSRRWLKRNMDAAPDGKVDHTSPCETRGEVKLLSRYAAITASEVPSPSCCFPRLGRRCCVRRSIRSAT